MQLEQPPPSYYKERILKMKNKVVMQPHEICIERAILVTDSYKNTKEEPPVIRFAKAMNHLLTNMSIKIWENEFIIGNQCSKFVGTPLYPEINVEFLEQDGFTGKCMVELDGGFFGPDVREGRVTPPCSNDEAVAISAKWIRDLGYKLSQ